MRIRKCSTGFVRKKYLTNSQKRKSNYINYILCKKPIIKHFTEGKTLGDEDDEEDVGIWRMNLREKEYSGN
jgi:hypothetical protein